MAQAMAFNNIVATCDRALPKVGDVRHHYEIRVTVGVGVVCPVVVVVVDGVVV